MRKTNVEQILRGRPDGIFVATFEQGKIGPDLFDAACRMGLEGLECCLGTSPIQAEKLRPDRKVLGSATLATSAAASIGPTAGM
jgi:hypothetical protein